VEILFLLSKERKQRRWLEGELKRGEASLLESLPPPLLREGDKGGGLPNKT